MSLFVQHHLKDVLLDDAGFSLGSRTGLAVLLGHPTRTQEILSQHGAVFLPREKHLPVQKRSCHV